MKRKALYITFLLISILILNIVFVSASDEFWIMEFWVDSPMNFGLATDSDSNITFAYTLYTEYPTNRLIRIVEMSGESGQVQWHTIHNDVSEFNFIRDIIVDSQDNVIVLGTKGGDWLILKYDSSGTSIWETTYDSGGGDYPSAVTVDSSDNIIVAGKREALCITRRYDSDGGFIDEMVYEEDCTPNDVAADSEDNIIVVGWTQNLDYFIVKYGEYGELWRKTYDRGSVDYAYGVAVDSGDNIVVTGQSKFMENLAWYFGYLTLKYDPSGNLLWEKSFDNMEYESLANDVTVDQRDNIYVTGRSGDEVLTIRYDPDGNSRWVRRYNTDPDPCIGQGVAVGADGNLIVACYSGGSEDATYYIIKYLLVGEDGDWQSSINELSDDISALEEAVGALQELVQGILDWIGKLPIGLKKLYEG
jgi:outer membrane protein assembly factor BamB